ncbi:MAG: hypothetical protein K2I67_03080 [Malacoplasma sp.]|nr:hypothetical protein [Malacoplasma sp.]
MSIKRKSLKISSLLVAGILGGATLSLSACSTLASEIDTLITYNPTDFLQSNNSPLNGSFTNAPISTSVKTEMLNLLDYQTTNQFKFSGSSGQTVTDSTTHDFLILQGASALIVFKDANAQSAFNTDKNISLTDNTTNKDAILSKLKEVSRTSTISSTNNGSSTTYKEGTDFWIFLREKGAIQLQKGPTQEPENPLTDNKVAQTTSYYSDAISNGAVYQFIIDTDNNWVDSNGTPKQKLSSKDFERAIEAYYLSADLGYNRNGYFLDLLGIDSQRTIGNGNTTTISSNTTNSFKIVDPNYDVEDYRSKNDAVFSLYLNSPYVYTNDLLTKDFFAGLPYSNQKVRNITLKGSTAVSTIDNGGKKLTTYKSPNYPIVYNEVESGGDKTYSIDESQTDWNRIFGSGGLGYFMEDAWFGGPYYISSYTSSKIVYELSWANKKSIQESLLDFDTAQGFAKLSDDQKENLYKKRIKTINFIYGSGNDDVYYQMFKSNQVSFVNPVPDAYKSEAADLFGRDNGGLVPIKTVQIARSNYIAYTPRPYILDDNNKPVVNSYITKEFANFDYRWTSKDSMIIRAAIAGLINHYQLSLINLPGSGDFQLSATPFGTFNNYYESVANSNFYGGLPRSYSDYKNSKGYILGSFEIPYYKYENSTVTLEKVTVDKNSLKQALTNYGATASSPLIFSYKLGEGAISNNYQSYLNSLTQQITNITDGLISFRIVERNGSMPTYTEWYNRQSSPLGFSYWSPDYNGVGTWLEADSTLQISGSIEGVSGTNAHNSYLTYLSALVSAVKLTSATYSSNKYTISSSSTVSGTSNNDPFKDDEKIQKAFSDENKKYLGISSWSNDVSIDESDSAGIKYAKLALGLLNLLIEQNVFDQSKFNEYVQNPSKLSTENKTPTTPNDLYLGNDVIKAGKSAEFSKWLGVYAGQATDKALVANVILDSDYSYIPRSEAGLNEFIYTLVSPQFEARISSVTPVNYRDFGKK